MPSLRRTQLRLAPRALRAFAPRALHPFAPRALRAFAPRALRAFRAALCALTCAALLLGAGRAAAQSSEGEQAKAAYVKGQTEYNLGNYREALRYFEEAYRMRPVPALLFNIGQCYRFVGENQKAINAYRSFLRNSQTADKNVGLAKELLVQVEEAVSKQAAAQAAPPQGLAQPDGSRVPVDGPVGPPQVSAAEKDATERAAAQKSAAQRAAAQKSQGDRAAAEKSVGDRAAAEKSVGDRAAAGKAAGLAAKAAALASAEKLAAESKADQAAAEKGRTVAATDTKGTRTAPSAPASATRAAPPVPAAAGERGRVFTWVAAGGAALALGGGAVFGLKSKSGASELEGSPHTRDEIQPKKDAVKSDANKANLLFAAGGVLAALSATFFILEF